MITALIAIAASAVTAFATWRLCRAGQVLDAILRDALEPGPGEAGQALRAGLAEEIASAIEKAVCEPGEQCSGRFCADCVKYAQMKADAATARRIGGAS